MKISIIGSGNVATHLVKAFVASGHEIVQVCSRNLQHAEELAAQAGAQAVNRINQLNDTAGLYIISVSDDAISQTASEFPFQDKLLVHTSGTTDAEVLKSRSESYGVFYPLQTFSKQKDVDFDTVPLLVEGNTDGVTKTLLKLGGDISGRVLHVDSEGRQRIHLAAVFACNFSNHFYALAEDILNRGGLEFDLIRPLILETALKVQSFSPSAVQTGPAARRDYATINKHLKTLEDTPGLQALYEKVTESILGFDPEK